MLARGDPGAIGPARAPAQVSVILPVHDAEPWLDECLGSVLQQDFEGSMELSIFNDASKDKSMTIIEKWKKKLEDSGILVVIGGHDSPSPRGVGYSKNQAVAQSSGSYLCFLDADDVMMPQRVRLQHEAALRHPESIIGCQVTREPPNSTERYMRWINQLAPDQLLTQVFTSNGPTVIMPTWFCSRAWFAHVGPFDEGGRGRTHAGLWLRNRDVDPDCSPSLLDSLRGNTPTEHPVRRFCPEDVRAARLGRPPLFRGFHLPTPAPPALSLSLTGAAEVGLSDTQSQKPASSLVP
ncbi:UDP-GlcNAc:betaGal beta-1,3-N-acetylglucosaminyltransferase-like protein 1 isoform X4 [Ovis aries]|uniref:UDP-GlcNAc:betaGal beta-1,3-N-acetylglucosaminyltransferase-like protein 1 isoform X4 n=1 Tax=Ovis aries TaxID=9940 RepID=UPI001C2E0103|nr:UDP-GlcNAc:betaGal beta-1,3-N-acetylglucosaminyltransferase-like protein 1 isoform X4 [Ovis aries]